MTGARIENSIPAMKLVRSSLIASGLRQDTHFLIERGHGVPLNGEDHSAKFVSARAPESLPGLN